MNELPTQSSEPAPISIVDAYLNAWRRVFDYRGVSTRREYWAFVLTHWLVLFPVIGFFSGAWIFEANWMMTALAGTIVFGHMAVAGIVSLSLTIRRVRDATSSGWFTFLIFANPWLILGIAACPRYDAKALANLPDRYWDVWRKTADYLGVSKRGEFWSFSLINLVVTAAVIAIAILLLVTLPGTTNNSTQAAFGVIFTGMFVILLLLTVAAVPWVPLLVRRCRDATGSGWVAIVGFVFIPLSLVAAAIICLLPSREPDTPARDRVAARPRPEPEEREDDDPWAR